MQTQTKPRLAVLTVELTGGQRECVLIPDGEFRAADGSGRPEGIPAWRNNADIAARLIARCQSRTAKIVVDYEHQTLNKEKNGQPAPAAGRIDRRSLRYEAGVGVLGTIEWTVRAEAMIAAGEYLYLSPVFSYDARTGEVLSLAHVALTNDPGLDDLIVEALTATFLSTEEEPQVNETLKKLLAALGVEGVEKEEAALAAGLSSIASLSAKTKTAEEKVAALAAQQPDPARYVSVETMRAVQDELATLSAKVAEDQALKVVDAAMTAGKLIEPQREWALKLGKTDPAALVEYLDKTPVVAALGGMQTIGTKISSESVVSLTAIEKDVAQKMGMSEADYLEAKKAG